MTLSDNALKKFINKSLKKIYIYILKRNIIIFILFSINSNTISLF